MLPIEESSNSFPDNVAGESPHTLSWSPRSPAAIFRAAQVKKLSGAGHDKL